MQVRKMRIGICAPSTPLTKEDAERVTTLTGALYSHVELVFDSQCFEVVGHFAGDDAMRLSTFVRMANDPAFDAIWFARGGYGACRIAGDARLQLKAPARDKIYMGYSDQGNMLGALYKAGVGQPTHGPMPADIRRKGGEAAVARALAYLVERDVAVLEPNMVQGQKYAAFNLMTLSMMVGTPLLPNLHGHILMVEEVSEYLYAFDRAMFNVTSNLAKAGLAGLLLGRVSDVPENDRPFGETAEDIALRWCAVSGIPFLGLADIGHDAANKVMPFGIYR